FEIVANSVTTIENCHLVQITVPEDIDSCFNFTVGGLGDGEYPLETGINTMENNENGGLTLLVYNLNNATMPCAKKEVEIVCCPTCKVAEQTISMFPNPANNNVYFELSDSKDKIDQIIMKNIVGRKILDIKNSATFNVSRLNAGVYFVTIITQNNQMYKRRLIVK
ncbi:T9SS type A sorting domain-containing protein, partial [Lacinutrix himadriensis]|uniref:T9SS type A sorting domain-containing protein n=1 Tax=Lacinutrix himadriensis TaxID=641549 RepID=UPI000B053625